MTRVSAIKQQKNSDLEQIDKVLLSLARLFGEASAADALVTTEAVKVPKDDPQNDSTKLSTKNCQRRRS